MTEQIREEEDMWREFQGEMVGIVKTPCQTIEIEEDDKISRIEIAYTDQTLSKITFWLESGTAESFGDQNTLFSPNNVKTFEFGHSVDLLGAYGYIKLSKENMEE